MGKYIDADVFIEDCKQRSLTTAYQVYFELSRKSGIDIVFCKECKYRPVKEDVDGENYGFNLIKPNDGDSRCPCLVEDGWYSWMPRDDFFCGYGERDDK